MISAYQSALSALTVFSTRIQSNANNIANVSSQGYKKTRVTMAEAGPEGGVKTNIEKVNTPGTMSLEDTSSGQQMVELSNVDLESELPEMQLNTQMYKANLKTIETQSEMTGSLLKILA
jgi:flagellar basal-body rod protein FlgC